MGLDQYALYCDAKALGQNQVDFNEDDLKSTEFCYWRKHPNLHGWMEDLYRRKGGRVEGFNCVPVRLETEDLDHLYDSIKSGRLPETTGFFFGKSSGSEEESEYDYKFIRRARQLLREGNAIFYTSSW